MGKWTTQLLLGHTRPVVTVLLASALRRSCLSTAALTVSLPTTSAPLKPVGHSRLVRSSSGSSRFTLAACRSLQNTSSLYSLRFAEHPLQCSSRLSSTNSNNRSISGACSSDMDAASSKQLQDLCEDFFEWRLQNNPEFATEQGFHQHDGQVEDCSLQALDTRKERVDHFLSRARSISRQGLTQAEVIRLEVLTFALETVADGYQWRFHGNLNLLTFLEGRQTHPDREASVFRFRTVQDFDNYILRLNKRPRQLSQIRERFQEAIRRGRTLHRVSVEPLLGQIGRLLVATPEESPFYKPFLKELSSLEVADAVKESLRARGRESVMAYLKAYEQLQQFLSETYLQHTRERPGIDSWDQGEDLYRQCLRWHLTCDMEPEEVYERGLAEVERISQRMKEIMERQRFKGTLPEFFDSLRQDPRFHTDSAEELLRQYREIVDQVYPRLPLLFRDIPPRRPKVEMMPYDGPGGEYYFTCNTFYVNLHHPADTNLFGMMSLTLHETVPGHHLQFEYLHINKLPDFQSKIYFDKCIAVPYTFPFFTAYIEGWALYAESLGEELGLYKDDFELLGKYGEEMLRACRLVVDTGLHSRGWTRDQAIQYMVDRCPASYSEIETEVDRYITLPGQACAYKIGELKIQELRRMAEKALGAKFDIREFHWVVLINGPVPLGVLSMLVRDWVASQGGDLPDMDGVSWTGSKDRREGASSPQEL